MFSAIKNCFSACWPSQQQAAYQPQREARQQPTHEQPAVNVASSRTPPPAAASPYGDDLVVVDLTDAAGYSEPPREDQ